MDERLSRIYNACDPLAPATKEYYLDCTAARGGGHFTRTCLAKLARSGRRERFLFTGHWGCGKSSELLHLRDTLLDGQRYFPVYLDSDEYLDRYDVSPTDVLLAIVTELSATLRVKLGIELQGNALQRRLADVGEALGTGVEVSEGEIGLGIAKFKVRALQRDPAARKTVRDKLAPQMTGIIDEVNLVFEDARKRLAAVGFGDIVLIIDALEKVQRVTGLAEGDASLRQLYLTGAPMFTALDAHIVLTVPLVLTRAAGPQLCDSYGVQPYVLPMIKVHQRVPGTRFEPGWDCLRDILQRRLSEIPLQEAFTSEALDWMLKYCGGHVRQLMQFAVEASAEVDELPITLAAARRAIAPAVQTFSSAVKHWEKLARLDADPDQRIENDDPAYLELLDQESVLEYVDGGTEDDPIEPSAPWYAVHPIVRELRPFKDARAALAEAAK